MHDDGGVHNMCSTGDNVLEEDRPAIMLKTAIGRTEGRLGRSSLEA